MCWAGNQSCVVWYQARWWRCVNAKGVIFPITSHSIIKKWLWDVNFNLYKQHNAALSIQEPVQLKVAQKSPNRFTLPRLKSSRHDLIIYFIFLNQDLTFFVFPFAGTSPATVWGSVNINLTWQTNQLVIIYILIMLS